ncbi:hypothetical protein BGZ75_000722, partial [Mortierella antarctica]
MSSENSISRAIDIAHPGLKDEVSNGGGILRTVSNTRRLPFPENVTIVPEKGRASTGKASRITKLSNFQAGKSGNGVSGDKHLMDHHRPDPQFSAETLFSTQMEESLKSQLLSFAHDNKSNLATTVLVAWTIVLSRLSGEESIVLDVGGTFGKEAVTNPITMHVDLSGEPNTSKLLDRVHHNFGTTGTCRSAASEPVNLSNNGDEHHLSQASFYAHTGSLTQPLIDQVYKQFCLELHLLQDKDIVTMTIRAAASLYNKDIIERYAGYLQAILKSMVVNKSQSIASFDMLSPDEKKLLLETWNAVDQPYPGNTCLHQLFEDQ